MRTKKRQQTDLEVTVAPEYKRCKDKADDQCSCEVIVQKLNEDEVWKAQNQKRMQREQVQEQTDKVGVQVLRKPEEVNDFFERSIGKQSTPWKKLENTDCHRQTETDTSVENLSTWYWYAIAVLRS